MKVSIYTSFIVPMVLGLLCLPSADARTEFQNFATETAAAARGWTGNGLKLNPKLCLASNRQEMPRCFGYLLCL